MQRILRLNPDRPHATRRTFGRRRQHQQPTPQPTPVTDTLLTPTEPDTNQFTIGLNHLPNQRLTQSLLQTLPYCVCCLCNQDHPTPNCPPGREPTLLHRCQIILADPEDIDHTLPPTLSPPDWNALHWEIWNSPTRPHEPTNHPATPPPPHDTLTATPPELATDATATTNPQQPANNQQ